MLFPHLVNESPEGKSDRKNLRVKLAISSFCLPTSPPSRCRPEMWLGFNHSVVWSCAGFLLTINWEDPVATTGLENRHSFRGMTWVCQVGKSIKQVFQEDHLGKGEGYRGMVAFWKLGKWKKLGTDLGNDLLELKGPAGGFSFWRP